jgi:hypothetical protein
MADYVVLKPVAGKRYCVLQSLENAPDPLAIRKGVSLQPWPGNVRFGMDPNFPKQVQLPDCVRNLQKALVVSKRFKEFVEATAPSPHLEYLPVTIIDHKGKVASADYFVINPIPLQDCIDQQASDLMWNPIDPTLIASCTRMVIDEARIEPDMPVFRMKHYPSPLLVARSLANRIADAGFTGFDFGEVDELE